MTRSCSVSVGSSSKRIVTKANVTMILILGLLSVVSGQVMEGLVQLDKSSIDKVRQIKRETHSS